MSYDKKYGPAKIAFFALFAVTMIILLGWIVMLVWNMLMPELFGLPTLTFFQTIGLVFLGRMIFGGGHSRGHYRGRKSHWSSDWHDKHHEDHEATSVSTDTDTDEQTN